MNGPTQAHAPAHPPIRHVQTGITNPHAQQIHAPHNSYAPQVSAVPNGSYMHSQTVSKPRMSLEVIAEKLEHLRFKVALFGYSKKDVWHKISRLDEMYRELYEMQEFRYQSLLRERDELLKRSGNPYSRM